MSPKLIGLGAQATALGGVLTAEKTRFRVWPCSRSRGAISSVLEAVSCVRLTRYQRHLRDDGAS